MIPIIKSTHKPSRKAVREAIRTLHQNLSTELNQLPPENPRVVVLTYQLKKINAAIEMQKGAR